MNPCISRLWPLLAPISMSIDFTHSKTNADRKRETPENLIVTNRRGDLDQTHQNYPRQTTFMLQQSQQIQCRSASWGRRLAGRKLVLRGAVTPWGLAVRLDLCLGAVLRLPPRRLRLS